MNDTQRHKVATRIFQKIKEDKNFELNGADPEFLKYLVDLYYSVVLIELDMNKHIKDFNPALLEETRRAFQYQESDYDAIYAKVRDMTDELLVGKIVTYAIKKEKKIL